MGALLATSSEAAMPDSIDRTVPFRFSGYAGMDVGCDNGLQLDRDYADKSPLHVQRHDQEDRARRRFSPDRGGAARHA
jgi:hypothetical protein